MPDQLRESFDTRKKSWILSVSAILMTMGILAISAFIGFKLQETSYQREHLKSEKSGVEKMIYGTRYQQIKNEIATFNKEVGELRAIDTELFSLPVTLKAIYKLMPEGISLTSFAYSDEEVTFEISGIAIDRAALLAAQNNLEKADFVEKVVAPISNYDAKTTISFKFKIKLNFTKLSQYGSSTTAK